MVDMMCGVWKAPFVAVMRNDGEYISTNLTFLVTDI